MADWASYYVILGSSGAALIGMQFVVMTLIANRRRRPTADALKAFGTSTVVHLTGALLISAIMSAPWRSVFATSVTLVICGVGGLAYGTVVIRRVRRQTYYEPVWQDWLWYAVLPWAVYAWLTVSALFLRSNSQLALLLVAAAALGLLLIGIHNAWDTVTHIVIPHEDAT
jgi:hypothetical protein